MKIQIILGSTRAGRVGPRIAKWVETAANEIDGFEAEIIDLAWWAGATKAAREEVVTV